ncbi:hypothetical protein [uncultured Cardiobacterium sp.]|uniref:hypothetical protein n=1 Tax=uncultured Cardiobacterium sp. TaxID=417619 RepID=UPI00260717C3|nr:hypothetical protein [uncultured Cardiobacterium sp.]
MKKLQVINIIIGIAFCAVIIFQYVGLEQDIYFWDYARSWRLYFQSGELLKQDFFIFLQQTGSSIYAQDYNNLSSALLLPFYFILPQGDNRFTFILAISLLYLIPTVLLICHLIRQNTAGFGNREWLLCFWLTTSFLPFWKPIMRGYTDIAGMIPILFCLFYTFKYDLSEKISFKHVLVIGISLWISFVLRRWYAYTIIAMYLVLPCMNLWANASSLELKVKIRHLLINYGSAASITFTCIFIFQQNLFQSILYNDYKEAYSAYRFPWQMNIEQATSYFGYLFIGIGILSWLLSVLLVPRSRKLLVGTAMIGVISYVGFYRSVSPDMHHFIPMGAWLLLPILVCFSAYFRKIRNTILQNSILFIVLTLGFLVQANSLFPINISLHKRLLPSTAYPLYLENYDNYTKLVNFLQEKLFKENKDNAYFSIVSADFNMNYSLFASIAKQPLVNFMILNPDIDLRDGLPIDTLYAKYLVTTYPAGTYLPSGQENVKIISHLLLRKEGIGQHYREVARFKIDGGTDAIVYEKVSPISRESAIHYIKQFLSLYPKWEKIYLNEETIALLTRN